MYIIGQYMYNFYNFIMVTATLIHNSKFNTVTFLLIHNKGYFNYFFLCICTTTKLCFTNTNLLTIFNENH
jgi:hypothetical protein